MHYMHYMHYKDYIYHDFYVYSPVLLTQYLGHCWHTPCTELYILRISAWLLRKPPSPATGGGEPSGWGRGGVWGSLLIYTCKQALEIRLERPVFAPLEHLLASHITSTSIIFCESDSSGDSSDATSTYCTDSSITLAHLSGDCGRKSMFWASWTLSHAIQAQGHITKQNIKGKPRLKCTTPQRTSRITPSNGSTALCLCAKNRFNKFQHQDWKGSHIYKPCIVRSFQHVSNMCPTCVQHVFNMFSACFPCCLLAASCTASFTLQVVKFKNLTLAGAIRTWEQHLKTAQIAHPWQIRITMT